MSNSIYIVENLITSLQNRGLPPTSQNTFTAAQFTQILSEEMLSSIVPLLDSVSEEYFVTNSDLTYSASINTYAIPYRAVGNKLRDVVWVDTNGFEIGIPRLRPEDIKNMAMSSRYQPAPWGYYLKDDSVVLFLGNSNAGTVSYPTLRLKFLRRPSILTLSANCGQVTAINGNVLTLSNAKAAWAIGTVVDIIKGTPNFVSRVDDIAITNVSGFNITFASLPSSVAVGDWVADANYSPIPQIPVESHLLLAQYGACKVLEAMGDAQGLSTAKNRASEMASQFLAVVSPRVDGGPIKLVSRNGIGDWMDGGF